MMKNYEDALKRCELDFEDRIKNDNILLTGRIDIEILQETLKEYKILKGKSIPKRPIKKFYEGWNRKEYSFYDCPRCEDDVYEEVIDDEKPSFCPHCGQALKWEGTK